MKKFLEKFFLLCFLLLIVSCASKPAILPTPEWRYEKDAIRLQMKSDAKLNLYEGSPHTLLICVYQLGDPNAFNQLKEEKEGLSKLLECGRFDPAVVSSKRLVVQPGQDSTLLLDRAENAKYVGIVAGYYLLQKDRVIRLQQIPVLEEVTGWLSKTRTVKPGTLNMELYLGPQEILGLKGK
ncbi:MAG: type VI secretion system lipoprotein TssJ [Thermodesulfobacteriota bacterium]|nr:type VI secretion system lipoprotein TssJ [Thermodesulfobacteriota bacterium]